MSNNKETQKNKCKTKEGDESMEMTKSNVQALDVDFILAHGKQISSQEALTEITPVEWSKEVLDGKYENNTIIKSKNKEDKC